MSYRCVTDGLQHRTAVRLPASALDRYILSLDLGQINDPSAAALVRRVAPPDWDDALASSDCPEGCRYEVLGLKRFPLGTPYPAIVDSVGRRLESLADRTAMLVADATGVGKPVIDLCRRAALDPVAVTITGGFHASEVGRREWHVPKRDLVSILQVLLQQGRLEVSGQLPGAALLRQELLSFRVRVSEAAYESYGAWREGEHDDLVIAVALACWAGETIKRKRIRLV